ncbi:DUF222 domain-containing protein [Williamsia sp. M5A3_1d]
MTDIESNYAALEHLLDTIATQTTDACSEIEVADLAQRHETIARRIESLGNRRILEVSDRNAHQAVGCVNMTEFLRSNLRITHPKKRMAAVQALEPMLAMTGEKLPPACPTTAAEATAGTIGPDHVHAVLDVMAKIPSAVDVVERAKAEKQLAEFAVTLTPKEISAAGSRILAHLDPDGELTDDRDRNRQRKLSLGAQDSQLMSKLSATLDPATRALFDVVLAAWAAPGMNNPDDDQSPSGDSAQVDPAVLREAADCDCRSQSQRNHDALTALLRAATDGGLLGESHRGLPPHIIVSITDEQLREHAGIARTATGADLPMSDVVKLAADAQPHLTVFSETTGEPLFYGRAKRLASRAQRFMAFAKYKGCSKDNCPVPFAHTEMHHAETDWADGGLTDSTDMAPACGPHNRAVGDKPHHWVTEKIVDGPDRGRYGWRRNTDPPEQLRANHLHRIDELLRQGSDMPASTRVPETSSTATDPWIEPAVTTRPRGSAVELALIDIIRRESPSVYVIDPEMIAHYRR